MDRLLIAALLAVAPASCGRLGYDAAPVDADGPDLAVPDLANDFALTNKSDSAFPFDAAELDLSTQDLAVADLALPFDSTTPLDLSIPSDLATPSDLVVTPDLPNMGMACLVTLANIGAADFTISFNLVTQAMLESTVTYQRNVCNSGVWWDVRMEPNGFLNIETDDVVHYNSNVSMVSVNDGLPHAVSFQRRAGSITAIIDGAVAVLGPSLASFGALSPLGSVSGDPCEGQDGTVALIGSVTTLCLSSP